MMIKSEDMIEDKYFQKGFAGLKIFQTFVATIGWILVILPFVWILLAINFGTKTFSENLARFLSMVTIFFVTVMVIILFIYIPLTILNNRKFKRIYEQKNTFGEDTLVQKEVKLEKYFEARFGTKLFREHVRYYSVSEDQNISNNEINELFGTDDRSDI